MRAVLLTVTAAALLAGCSANTPRAAAVPPPPPKDTQQTGAAEACIDLNRIRESLVRDDRTIDFVMRTGGTLRNTLPFSCPQLGFEKAFTYSTSINRLCSTDIITVIVQGGGVRTGASCGLGKFVPYTPIPKAPG